MSTELKRVTLMRVNKDQAFRVKRGDVILHIRDLANCVEDLPEEDFRHHVGESHNHFAEWVEVVLQNPGLAKDLNYEINKRDKKHFAKTIRDHVDWLENF